MEGSVDVFDGDGAGRLARFEFGLTDKVVVMISLKTVVLADDDDEDVTGGNPKMEPCV